MGTFTSLAFQLRERAFLAKQQRRLARLDPYRVPLRDEPELLAAVRRKRVVFTITAGRTGTTYLQHLIALCPDTASLHEPEPNFVAVLRLAQHDAAIARRFLLEYKLPSIAAVAPRRYVESGHLFCKGFLEPLVELGVIPGAVLLRRSPQRIARSLLARRTVPGRGKLGLKYLLHPEDPGVLPLPRWTGLGDYALCFWYALEIERRQRVYGERLRGAGAAVVDVTAEELHDGGRFLAMVEALGLLDADTDRQALLAGHARESAVVHNPNARESAALPGAEAVEEDVWERIAPGAPELRGAVEGRYA